MLNSNANGLINPLYPVTENRITVFHTNGNENKNNVNSITSAIKNSLFPILKYFLLIFTDFKQSLDGIGQNTPKMGVGVSLVSTGEGWSMSLFGESLVVAAGGVCNNKMRKDVLKYKHFCPFYVDLRETLLHTVLFD